MASIDGWLEGFMHGQGSVMLVLLVSLALGLRHATDPDHLAAVTTLIASEEEREQITESEPYGPALGARARDDAGPDRPAAGARRPLPAGRSRAGGGGCHWSDHRAARGAVAPPVAPGAFPRPRARPRWRLPPPRPLPCRRLVARTRPRCAGSDATLLLRSRARTRHRW